VARALQPGSCHQRKTGINPHFDLTLRTPRLLGLASPMATRLGSYRIAIGLVEDLGRVTIFKPATFGPSAHG
jgi:hypothetical protein